MEDLLQFANRDDVAPIAQAATVHAQFEAIHPFTDGNGRIGRGLINGVLRHRGVTRNAVVPIASAMLADVDAYFDMLSNYRDGDVESLVSYMAISASAASTASNEATTRISTLPDQLHEKVTTRKGSSARTLIDGLLASPVLNIQVAAGVTGSSKARTYEAIDTLVDAGILTEVTNLSRNRIWVASDVVTEVDMLGEQIGKRSRPSSRWQ